ncbi:ABC transporter permease [Moheibacter stercoris]|uniref:ABC-type transport system involved in multi-copper enzyme maturation permease subunit n=1 Tax=Moheibacter stercoris TaxID=1628251 RepID=A0ABV2LWQ5_9FLAO
MIRLLLIEWNKIFYYQTARIFTILYFVMLILMGVGIAMIKPNVGEFSLNLAKLGMFNFPVVWQNMTYMFAIAKIFLAVIIITNVTNEYSNGTLKQNLIDGLSKREFIQSKILTNFVFASLSTLFVLVITFILGVFIFPNDNSFFSGVEFIGAYFLKLMLFFSICLFFSIFLKKSAFALLGIVVWWMIEKAFHLVEFMIYAFRLDWDFEKAAQTKFWISEYLPLNTSYNLIQFPEFEPMNFINGLEVFSLGKVDISFVIVAIVYTLLFWFLSFRLLKKRDL